MEICLAAINGLQSHVFSIYIKIMIAEILPRKMPLFAVHTIKSMIFLIVINCVDYIVSGFYILTILHVTYNIKLILSIIESIVFKVLKIVSTVNYIA